MGKGALYCRIRVWAGGSGEDVKDSRLDWGCKWKGEKQVAQRCWKAGSKDLESCEDVKGTSRKGWILGHMLQHLDEL